jgi:hypothetical protein
MSDLSGSRLMKLMSSLFGRLELAFSQTETLLPERMTTSQ